MTAAASSPQTLLATITGRRVLAAALGAALLAIFVIGRAPLYSGYWIPWYVPDSGRYFQAAYALASGDSPTFSLRTPGYPLFLATAIGITHRVSTVIVVQQFATLVAGFALYLALARARIWLALPAAISVAGFFSAGDLVLYETYIGPECLYTASLVGAVAAMISGFASRTPAGLAVSSLLMAYAILLRPAGMFLLIVFAIVVLALLALKYSRACVLAMGVPFPLILLSLALYNLVTIHQLTISPFGSVNLVGATATFWEDSPLYPQEMRGAIAEMRSAITPEDRVTLASSWDPETLFNTYNRYYNLSLHVVLARHVSLDTADASINDIFKTVAFDAIRAHPLDYAKFVYTSLYNFLIDAPRATYSFGSFIEARYQQIYGQPPTAPIAETGTVRAYMLQEFAAPAELSTFRMSPDEANRWVVHRNAALRLHEYVSMQLFPVIFDTTWWLWLSGALVLAVVINFAIPPPVRASPVAILGAAIVSLILLGAALVVSLVELGLQRYAAPTRFCYFLSLPFLAWIIVEWAVKSRRARVHRSRADEFRSPVSL